MRRTGTCSGGWGSGPVHGVPLDSNGLRRNLSTTLFVCWWRRKTTPPNDVIWLRATSLTHRRTVLGSSLTHQLSRFPAPTLHHLSTQHPGLHTPIHKRRIIYPPHSPLPRAPWRSDIDAHVYLLVATLVYHPNMLQWSITSTRWLTEQGRTYTFMTYPNLSQVLRCRIWIARS